MLVTNGAQHAWTLLLRVLAGPGDRVLTEHPTYPAALDAVRAIGARPVPVPMLADGWDLDMLEATLRQAAPRLAYVIADHQNPTGLTMPAADARAARRARPRVAHAAGDRRARSPACTSTAATPPPPVAALDPEGDVVITTGSMSKTFWAGLRIGWIRANPALVQRLAAARMALDIASPVLEQLIAVELLAEADDDLPAPARGRPRAPRRAWPPRCARRCRSGASRSPAGGLSLWIELDAPRSTALAAIADRHGMRLAAGPRFGVDGAFERYLRVPYALPTPVLEDAVGPARRGLALGHGERAAGVQPAPALVA